MMTIGMMTSGRQLRSWTSVALPLFVCVACLGELERYPLDTAESATVSVSYRDASSSCPYLLDATVSFEPEVGAALRIAAAGVSRNPYYVPRSPVGDFDGEENGDSLAEEPVDMAEFASKCPELSAMWEQGSQEWEVVEHGWVEDFDVFRDARLCGL